MNINIKIEKETRKVWADKYTIGNDGENLQCNLVFSFDEFVDGQAMLFYEIDDESRFDYLEKVDEQYILPIKSTLTKQGTIPMQLVITEGINENEVPIFKTNIFKVNIGGSIEDGIEQPEEYPSWLEIANTKLNQIDEALLESETQSNYAKEQGDYAKKEATKVDEVVDYVVRTSEEANDKSKTAISISKGANQALSYDDYQTMITNFNAFESEKFNLGQQVMIRTLNVPDLWVYDYTNEKIDYEYVSDKNFVDTLREVGYVQVGWYLLAELETQKVDLTEYVRDDDFATTSKAGIIKTDVTHGLSVAAEGLLVVTQATETDIDAKISKYKPIVPKNLDYAVGSVKASETQSGTAKMWTSTNEDGEIGLNISTEV